jgi:hypothetical protein
VRLCPRCAAHVAAGVTVCPCCQLPLTADTRLQEEAPPEADDTGALHEAEKTLLEIERKRVDLPHSADRKRTRRFHRSFIITFFLVEGLLLLIALLDAPVNWSAVLWIGIGGSFCAAIAGGVVAVVVAMVADSASDWVDLWYWIRGRKRRRLDLDRIARRVNETTLTRQSLPSDPETSITPAGAGSSVEDPPSPEKGSADAITPHPTLPPVADDPRGTALRADGRPAAPGG